MGPASARRKRANASQMQAAAGLIPGPAIYLRLVNAAAFDKVKLMTPGNQRCFPVKPADRVTSSC
jgi:hypothetical protein